jgi:hypothetical protein
MIFTWNTSRSRGVWRPSFFLQMVGVLLKLSLLLVVMGAVLTLMYYVVTSP